MNSEKLEKYLYRPIYIKESGNNISKRAIIIFNMENSTSYSLGDDGKKNVVKRLFIDLIDLLQTYISSEPVVETYRH